MKSSHRTHPEAKGHAHKLQLKTDMDMHESKNCREFLDAQKFKSSDTGNKALSSFDDRLLPRSWMFHLHAFKWWFHIHGCSTCMTRAYSLVMSSCKEGSRKFGWSMWPRERMAGNPEKSSQSWHTSVRGISSVYGFPAMMASASAV